MIGHSKNISLKGYNTFDIDARARDFIEYTNAEDLPAVFAIVKESRFFHLGGGSNVLFIRDFDGFILHSKISGVEILSETDSDVVLKVGASVVWDEFVEDCVCKNLSGAENLSLIPGEVGASAVQNIGAYGVEAKDLIQTVYCYDMSCNQFKEIDASDCQYGYRSSMFKLNKNLIVTHVAYRLSKVFQPNLAYGNISSRLENPENVTLRELRDTIIAIRNEKLPDPKIMGNAGSFFMNPVVHQEVFDRLIKIYPSMPHYAAANGVKIPAGWLIEQCGWKGKSLGNAGVHKNQALVLVNLGGASAEEILNLSSRIVDDVKNKFGISIHPEVNFI